MDNFRNSVIVSDECKVVIGADRGVYVWRKAGEDNTGRYDIELYRIQ